jgi:hypothetical protein
VIFHSKNLHRLPGRVSLINWLNHVDHEHVDILSPAPPVLVFDLESMESVFQISTCFFFSQRGASTKFQKFPSKHGTEPCRDFGTEF